MKKYIFEIVLLTIQFLIFYLFPTFAKPFGAIGIVLLILLITFLLSMIMGNNSKYKIKLFYPLITAVIFIPTVLIYYNSSALIHTVWYFAVSVVGLFIGIIIKYLRSRSLESENKSV